MLKRICAIFVLCLLLASPYAWALDLEPGKYEITAKVEMSGMPGGTPAQTSTQCLTEQDPIPDSSASAQGCKVTEMKTKGNTVTYKMECDQQGMKTTSTGEMTYKGDSFEGSINMTMGPEAGGMTITTVVKGKRIGNCE